MKTLLGTGITLLLLLCGGTTAIAANGTIDATNHYAWDDNGGWVNWDATNSNVMVSDTALTGYVWSANFGWINLSPSQGGVTNSGGTLGGFAWGANTGWISFSGVTIDSTGVFHGHTVAQNVFGIMTFDCDNCAVVTSWRAGSSSSNANSSSGGGGTISGPLSSGYQKGISTTTPSATGASPTTVSTPAALVPTSKPSKTQQPTTKPPRSQKSSTYIFQRPPTPHPILAIGTSHASTSRPSPIQSFSATFTLIRSWFGSHLWHPVVNFFTKLIGGWKLLD